MYLRPCIQGAVYNALDTRIYICIARGPTCIMPYIQSPIPLYKERTTQYMRASMIPQNGHISSSKPFPKMKIWQITSEYVNKCSITQKEATNYEKTLVLMGLEGFPRRFVYLLVDFYIHIFVVIVPICRLNTTVNSMMTTPWPKTVYLTKL